MPPRRGTSQSVSNEPPSTPKAAPTSSSSPSTATSSALQRSPALSPLKERYDRVADSVRGSRIASPLGFVAAVILSFALSSVLFSVAAEFSAGDLAAVSKHTESWAEITGLLGWKVVQMAIYWFGDLSTNDTFTLTFVMCTPTNLLLLQYYSIRPTTVLFTQSANLISIVVPLQLVRRVSTGDRPKLAAKGKGQIASISSDPGTYLAAMGLAAGILAVLLQLSFATFLPVQLITHFAGIRNLSVTHRGAAGLLPLLIGLAPVGAAACEFLLIPSTAAPPSRTKYSFDPATAGFGQHVYHNAWGWYSPRQKVLIGRTLLMVALLMGETVIQVWGTIKGVELWGATSYAAMWGVGIVAIGAAFDWVGQPSDSE